MRYPTDAMAAWMKQVRAARAGGEATQAAPPEELAPKRPHRYVVVAPDGTRYEGLTLHEIMQLVGRLHARGPWQIATWGE